MNTPQSPYDELQDLQSQSGRQRGPLTLSDAQQIGSQLECWLMYNVAMQCSNIYVLYRHANTRGAAGTGTGTHECGIH